jgi:CxxC motif-containing protein (DUF1111 family)
MKTLKFSVLLLFAAALVVPFAFTSSVEGQGATEAPTGFSTQTNGFASQATFELDRAEFEQVEAIGDGLGPIYNAQSCRECHQNPVTGGISQITELRAGHQDGFGNFVAATVTINDGATTIANRSLINDRAICPGVVTDSNGVVIFNFPNTNIQERVPGAENIRTFRTSLNLFGDGFVECVDSNTLLAIANSQPGQSGGQIAGQFIQVPVLEAPGNIRGGRFGWKNQMSSLLSFSSDAYLNEMGITNRLAPNNVDVTSVCDTVADPEDHQIDGRPAGFQDIDAFAEFMRSLKAPSRDTALAATSDAVTGSALFDQIGCAICHVRNITTAPAGTVINGGAFTVPAALGNKIIHPFGDFLLHNVGTGDGIVQNGGQSTANRMRTPPLWGMRTRDRLMHDGETLTRNEAILRHFGEANFVINNYINLSTTQKNQLITFLNSL